MFNSIFINKNRESKLLQKYLKTNNDTNIYKFQKKFYNQSKLLLKVFGKVDNKKINELNLIIITDTHNTLNENKLLSVINLHPNYDLCILLGDHNNNDIDIILKYIDKNKLYCLLGNHDSNYIKNYSLNNLNGKIIEINGVDRKSVV